MSCARDHAAIKSGPEWASLPLVGVQHVEADDTGPAEDIEIRACAACGTTLGKVVTS